MRLLWVENHGIFARLAGQQFLSAHDLTVVPSLAAARSVVSVTQFDAVLLDYDLDDGKGVELVPFIRHLSSQTAIVATSSHEEGNAALVAAGANAICSKMNIAMIDAVLSSVIGQQR